MIHVTGAPPPKPRSRARDDQGQTTAMVTILVPAILLLGGLVLDGGTILASRREATALASGAARAAIQEIDPASLRAGAIEIDGEAAEAAATGFLTEVGEEGDVVVYPDRVEVTVTVIARPFLLRIVGIGDRPVTGSAVARLEEGQ